MYCHDTCRLSNVVVVPRPVCHQPWNLHHVPRCLDTDIAQLTQIHFTEFPLLYAVSFRLLIGFLDWRQASSSTMSTTAQARCHSPPDYCSRTVMSPLGSHSLLQS